MPVFQHIHRVTYAECTVGNHIYYSRYLDLLEAARGEFFRMLGRTLLEWQAQDAIFPVLECSLRYKAPARYDDVLTIEVRVSAAHGVRLNFEHRILNQAGVLLVECTTRHVCTTVAEKPRRLPADLLDSLKPWLTA